MAFHPGTRLGPYEIHSALGAGGMGEVYRARDARLERDVAIKVLPPSFSADADRLARFQQEARAAAALNHPNILAVFDRSDGRELFYESADGKVMAVPGEAVGGEFRAGTPIELFAIRTQGVVTNQPRNFEPSADGQRFLVNTVVGDRDNAPIEMIVNWPALLKKPN